MKDVFGTYDIRGKVGEVIDEDFASRLGWTFGNYISPAGAARFLIGFDSRGSSPVLAAAFVAGLEQGGHQVTNLGLGSTPLVNWVGASSGFDGIAVVTASHMGPNYTGFKLSSKGAVPLSARNGLGCLKQTLPEAPQNLSRTPSTKETGAPLAQYIERLLSYLQSGRTLKIALDGVNGVAGTEIKHLQTLALGIEIVDIGANPMADFGGIAPDPLETETLQRVSKAVIQHKCDFGAAFDGDMDRIVVVDERGQAVPTDVILTLLSTRALDRRPGSAILYDLRASRVVPETIQALGGKPIKTKVGNSFIHCGMVEHLAALAGELSGHYYFDELFNTDNAVVTLFELINLLRQTAEPLSAIVEPLTKYPSSGEINLPATDCGAVIAKLDSYFDSADKDYLDGLSVDFTDWWFNVRASQTEPLLRVSVGAREKAVLATKVENLLSIIRNAQAPV